MCLRRDECRRVDCTVIHPHLLRPVLLLVSGSLRMRVCHNATSCDGYRGKEGQVQVLRVRNDEKTKTGRKREREKLWLQDSLSTCSSFSADTP